MGPISLPIIKSLILHLMLGGLLLVSMDFHSPPKPLDMSLNKPIEAVLIDQSVLEERAKKKEAVRKAEEKKVNDQKKHVADAKRKKEKEAKAKRQREKEEARKLQEQKKRKELERKKAEEKRKKEEKAKKDAAKKRQDQQEKAEQERILQEQIQAERTAQAKRRSKVVLSEVQKYTVLIKQTIQRNLIVDDSYRGKSCRLNIRLASNGLVIKADVLKGDPALCRAAKAAVFKSDSLPVSKEADIFEKLKDINLTVEPEL